MSEPRIFLDGRVTLHMGDCRDVLRGMAENSIDSVVVDPPYHLTSIVKRFGGENAKPVKSNMADKDRGDIKALQFKRLATGFMGKQWDGGDIAFHSELWAEVLRVLKPGGYIMAFSGCRTYHRMACAIEDAGFITHPMFCYAFGSGFPKAHNLSKQLDKMAGVEREVISERKGVSKSFNVGAFETIKPRDPITAPATNAAREWDGWFYGTQSLKPAIEPVYFGQKPFEKGLNGAQNVQKWGVGAVNVGGCKVGADIIETCNTPGVDKFANMYGGDLIPKTGNTEHIGRWPANLIHDGSEEVLACFPETGISSGGNGNASRNWQGDGHTVGANFAGATGGLGDSGSAARFFYTAKADADDRLGSRHPTVKPLDLIQYLARLITPKNGVCLDLFAGTGTTAEACFREGFSAILIENDPESIADIERRMSLVMEGPVTRANAGMKARNRPRDDGPLFGGADLLDAKIELAKIAVALGCDIDVTFRKSDDGGVE